MSPAKLTAADLKRIDRAVAHFDSHRHLFNNLASSVVPVLRDDPNLAPLVQFIRARIKDPEHLHRKLQRIAIRDRGEPSYVPIDDESLFSKVNDLLGVRLIHLHTSEMEKIHPIILGIFDEQRYELIEEPIANCWDIEYEHFFQRVGIKTRTRDSMYSTVHYVFVANSRTRITGELQVRTLTDEVWGEVSHRITYPDDLTSDSCREQLKVLARLTTGCTRLVDSIFATHLAHQASLASGKGND